MEFKVLVSDLRDAINKIVSVVDKKSTRPILTYAKISVQENQIEVSATDLEVAAKLKVNAHSNTNGEFCVNAKNLSEILQALRSENELITMSLEDESNLNLTLNNVQYKLLVYKSDDFPHLAFGNIQNEFLISSKNILEIINKTSYAISNDETRLYLNGIFLQDTDGKLRAVSTDGHRLALLDTDVEINNIENLVNGIIVPKKGINELKKIAETYLENDLKISVDDSFMYVSAEDNYFLSIRLIAREYPKYQAVIPNKTTFTLTAEKELFLDAVKRIKIMANEKSNGVRAKLTENEIILSANHPSYGDAHETIPVRYDGKEMEIGFNARYLMDALSIIADNEIVMEINNELTPVIIRTDSMQNYLGMVMPLKL